MAQIKRKTRDSLPVWQTEDAPVAYEQAVRFMEDRVGMIRSGGSPELVWLLQHPPLYTAGTSADARDLIAPLFPLHRTGRGGQYTYHGPGQRVAYVMLDLQKRGSDLRRYIHDLEEWIMRSLMVFGIKGGRRDGRIGIWVKEHGAEAKIAAIGVRVRKWVTYHGVSINLNPDLAHYNGIVPCGIRDCGVTSCQKLGVTISMEELDRALQREWGAVFGPS